MTARRLLAAYLAAAALAISGCGFNGVYDTPLPGGADVGVRPYRVKVHFQNVLDLVQQANVKVNDVAVGRVEKIEVAPDGWSAMVTLLVNGDVHLPANSTAGLVQSSLLGEKQVELHAPANGTGKLGDGAEIPITATSRNTEVEELLGALSMLLNSGGVDQLQTIAQELNHAMTGNEPQIRELLGNLDHLVGTLDGQRNNITTALDSLNRLAETLSNQRETLGSTLDNLGPGLEVLNQQRTQLVGMLQALDKLSTVAVETVNKGKDDIVADLKALTPTLTKITEAGNAIPQSLQVLLTFPFTDNAIDTIRGDYTNLDVKLDLQLDSVLDNLGKSAYPPLSVLGSGEPADPGSPGAPVLPLPNLSTVPTPSTPQSGDLPGLLDTILGGR